MYCPICGQKQAAENIRFCSRCGFPLAGVSEVIANGGAIPQIYAAANAKLDSPRRRGIKRGAFLMLSCLLLTPLAVFLHEAFRLPDIMIPMVAVLTFIGGLLRIFYALLFESNFAPPASATPAQFVQTPILPANQSTPNALPPQPGNFTPANAYAPPQQQQRGSWRDANTGELVPPSITEGTTKLLDKENAG